jgi:hypothetical protein
MKMKKSDISFRGKIQHQKDIGYNLMDKHLGALAGLADIKPEVSMKLEEFAMTCHEHAEDMSWLLLQIADCQDGDEWESLKWQAEEATRKWRKFSQSKEAVNAA